ncbi:MAG: class I SAM-dependent methyltransferase, partial [Bacteroidota bacterium]
RQRERESGFEKVPHASLRFRVHGVPHLDSFLSVGKNCTESIEKALAHVGRDFNAMGRVLDFGCGCGRTLLWWGKKGVKPELFGTDIEPESIAWCQQHLDFVTTGVNQGDPPLAYPDNHFDLIYAISVFTHLKETHQDAWLQELQRVTAPNGIVLLSLHGQYYCERLPEPFLSTWKEKGIVYIKTDEMRSYFPEWYQATYHAREYIETHYAKFFEVAAYLPYGMNNDHDLVVLRKKA